MEKIFKLKENGTTVRTEIIAGVTTFLTMAYIIALNPNILTGYGQGGQSLWNGVFLATCIASAIAMFAMAFLANKPFCLGPGMGINSFFAVVVANLITMAGMDYVTSFQTVMCIVFIEGVLFIVLSLFNIREKIVEAIPLGVRLGIAPAIGMMLMNIGFGSNIYIADENYNQFYVMRDFFGALTAGRAKEIMGSAYPVMILSVITLFVGFFTIVILAHKGVKAAVIIGMFVASIVYWIGQYFALGTNPFAALESATFVPAFSDMAATTLFKLNFAGLSKLGVFTVITLVITFCLIDMFDTIGTLIGVSSKAGMLDENEKLPRIRPALLADAIATSAGAVLGTSTTTTYVESSAGVGEGARTGLASVVTGLLFLLAIFFAPIFTAIPGFATAPALIFVGFLMVSSILKVDFEDVAEAVPAYLCLVAMPLMYSISEGIAIGVISYVIINVICGKAKKITPLMYVLAVLFVCKYIFL